MGAMGRYIEQLSAEGRDRLLVASDWGHGASMYPRRRGYLDPPPGENYEGEDGARWCLVDHGCGRAGAFAEPSGIRSGAPARFDRGCVRFGLARVVRAIKLRATRLNGCSPEQINAFLESRPARSVEV